MVKKLKKTKRTDFYSEKSRRRRDYIREYEKKDDFINFLMQNQNLGVSRQQIRDIFGWSEKKIDRMLNFVEERFYGALKREYHSNEPHKKVYRLVLPDLSKKPQTFITANDITNLRTGASLLKNNVDLGRNINAIATKLENVNKNATVDASYMSDITGTVAIAGPKIILNQEIFEVLQNAILCFNMITMKYKGRKTTVSPLGFLYGVHNNYLVAANYKYPQTPGTYTLSNIESIEVLDKTFDAKGFDMSEFVTRSFGVFRENETGFDVEWLVDPSAVDGAKTYIFHPNQEMIDNPDGSMTVKFHSCGLLEMAFHIFTWGGKIVPISPKELVAIYKEYIKKAQDSLKKK